MNSAPIHNPPIRVTDLIELKNQGAAVSCSPLLSIIPVDFTHGANRFQALVFICRFSGTVDDRQYAFRKCYARGCAHDLCPRVSQAILIANRYLQRDYHRLELSGIPVESKLFTLEESMVRLSDLKEECKEVKVIDDYIEMAKRGGKVFVNVALEYVPATEHFEYHKNHQTFLMANFTVATEEKTGSCQRCLGCYATDREREDRPAQVQVANDRLWLLYKEFDLASVSYEKGFFAN